MMMCPIVSGTGSPRLSKIKGHKTVVVQCCSYVVCHLPADEAAEGTVAACHDDSAIADCSASSSVNEIMHRPSRPKDTCRTEEHICSSTSIMSNDCTGMHLGSDCKSGSDDVHSTQQCDALPSSSQVFCMLQLSV